jgi:hypothetical protein
MKEDVPSPLELKLYYSIIITEIGYGTAHVSIAVHASETTQINIRIS